MNSKFNLLITSMVITLGGLLILNSCKTEEAPPPLTFESDPAEFCAKNEFDAKCCIAEYNLDCYCSTGTNAETDADNCCLKEYNLTCFCENNPADVDCQQDFGDGNGMGLVINFEDGINSFAEDFYNPSGLIDFNGDASISAVEGNGYLSLVIDSTDTDSKSWHDFKYDPNEGENEATLDFSTMSNPTINFWVNSGANEADSLGFTVAFRGKDDGAAGNDETDYAAHPLFKTGNTGGKWVLMSFPLSDMTVQNGWDGGSHPVDVAVKYKLIKFAFLPDAWYIPGQFVAHVDAISITDGPLEQLPWTN